MRTLTRQELYDLVLFTLMTKLAESFGISDVGLAEICDRHRVPTPPRGYSRPFYAFDSMNPAVGCAYDALADKNFTTQSDMIVGLRPIWTEPHYKNKASKFSQTTFKTMAFCGLTPDLLTFGENLSVDKLLSLTRRNRSKSPEAKYLLDEILALRAIEKEAIDSLKSEVDNLAGAHFGQSFDIKSARRKGRLILRLHQARQERAIVYFGLPSLTYSETAAKIGALVIQDLKATLASSTTQWLYVFDEFSVFASAQVLNLVNMGRGYGGAAVLATQSFADFESEGSKQLLRQVATDTSPTSPWPWLAA